MQTPNFRRLHLGLVLAVLLGLAASASAQPRTAPADRQARLTERLALSPAQQGIVDKILSEAQGPAALWTLSAELTPTLSDEQMERLMTPPERRSARGEGRRTDRGQRPRGERSEENRPERTRMSDEDRAAHHAAQRQAMIDALGLSDRQVEQLDALRATHAADRAARRAERQAQDGPRPDRAPRAERRAPGEVPDALADILTEEQEAIWAVHYALTRHARPHRGRSHGGR